LRPVCTALRRLLAGLLAIASRIAAEHVAAPRGGAPRGRLAWVLYDPDGLIEAGRPLDREPYECLVTAVLAWTDQDTLTARDLQQIAFQLTGHARAVASDVRRRAEQLPKDSGPKALADIVLREAEGRLSTTIEGGAASRTAPASSARSTNAWTAWTPQPLRPCDTPSQPVPARLLSWDGRLPNGTAGPLEVLDEPVKGGWERAEARRYRVGGSSLRCRA
jgi:hypothetical protein